MDHDRLFKELLTAFFFEFVELFLPDLAGSMQRDRIQFLDKELFTDLASREKHQVDLLAKVRFKNRGAAFFLIHIENQSSKQKHFARRMFRYFARLHEKHALPVFPIALFSYDHPARAEPERYQIEFPGHCVLDFAFKAIQLNRLNWRDFLRNPNPVASALMAKMKIAPKDRPRVKIEWLRMMVTLKLDRARATLISTFMDSYLALNKQEAMVYNRELQKIEPEKRKVIMEYTNQWLREGEKKGEKKGERKGEQKALRSVALKLLASRSGSVPAQARRQIAKISDSQLTRLINALANLQKPFDVHTWLAKQRA